MLSCGHSFRVGLILAALILVSSCATKPSVTRDQATVDYDLLLTVPSESISYDRSIRPILEKRCVVCHGCYDAPCQLKLSSYEGLQRGASSIKVYDGARFRAADPTRLYIDARSTSEWRGKGFHTVLNEAVENDPVANLENSALYQMLRLKQLHPQPRTGMISDDVDVRLDRKQTCTTLDGFAKFASEHPLWGMPYAMPNLGDEEYGMLVQWIAQGSPGPIPAEPSASGMAQIRRWEAFLNGPDLKQKLVSRYLYEHLQLARIHFSDTSDREFYRLVRSITPPGQAVNEIATVRPYDDPGPVFYYRLQLYQPSIVLKDHNIYEWSDLRLRRYRELFIEPEYTVTALPGYDAATASNPFKVFEAIPPVSRYRFLLDDARYFIEGFIKGPVCRGQIALNVIEDQFWVFFVDPDPETITLQPTFLNASLAYLNLPAERGDDSLRVLSTWRNYLKRQQKYLSAKDVFLEKRFSGKDDALHIRDALKVIWDGDGVNINAALTVFRHYDSASVSNGLVGDYPETAWLIDYPLLERIHYLLVAGFNVYGNVTHQLTTRIYMDFLRMEAENQFLLFMPLDKRKQIHDSWYKGMHKKIEDDFRDFQRVIVTLDTVYGYQTDDPQLEFFRILNNHLGVVAGPVDVINRCDGAECLEREKKTVHRVDVAMRKMVKLRGEILSVFPDVSFIRIRTGGDGADDLAYTLILNKGYMNITSMFADEERRDRSDDSLTVVKGLTGAYPNFFFEIDIEQVDAFVERFAAIANRNDYEQFVGLYGVRRTNTAFWTVSDWFQAQAARDDALRAGIFDLNRYRNR